MTKSSDYKSDIVAFQDMLDIPDIHPGPDFFHNVVDHAVSVVRSLKTDPHNLTRAHAVKSAEITQEGYDETKGADSFIRLYNTLLDYKLRAHLAESVAEIGSGFRSVFNGLFVRKTFDIKVDPGYLLLRTMYSYALHPRTATPNQALNAILFDHATSSEDKEAALEQNSKEIMTKIVKAWILLLEDHPNAGGIKKSTYDFVAKLVRHPTMAVKYSDGMFSQRLLPVMEDLMPEIKAAEMLRQAAARAKAAERLRQLASLPAAAPAPSAPARL
jgi:hypothetical protein